MIVRLSKDEKILASKIAKIYRDIALSNSQFENCYSMFWRISLFVRLGMLTTSDYHNLIVTLEGYGSAYEKYPEKDPAGEYILAMQIAEKMKSNIVYQNFLEKRKQHERRTT